MSTALADFFAAQAEWRRQEGQQHPGRDERNLLSGVDPRRSYSADRELLADLAEEMLLTRADHPTGKRARHATDCLVRVVGTGALKNSVAEELWRAIRAAGPLEEPATEDRPVAAESA